MGTNLKLYIALFKCSGTLTNSIGQARNITEYEPIGDTGREKTSPVEWHCPTSSSKSVYVCVQSVPFGVY